ncbi:MAG: hypothetical protein MZV63_40090 [Marinilabiliales bacterium]|nr:hypothetical protein [Marinilabiliales bacterium]
MTAMGGTAAIFLGLSAYAREHAQGLQLHGRLPHGGHPGGLPRRPRARSSSRCRHCR